VLPAAVPQDEPDKETGDALAEAMEGGSAADASGPEDASAPEGAAEVADGAASEGAPGEAGVLPAAVPQEEPDKETGDALAEATEAAQTTAAAEEPAAAEETTESGSAPEAPSGDEKEN
jgi:hypothetical protein